MVETTRSPHHRLMWTGQGPLDEAVAVLNRDGCVELELPAEFHHALFRHLHPRAGAVQAEQVDEEGGAELLERVAEIDQLAQLNTLIAALKGRTPRVNVRSPAPHLTVCV